MKGLYGKRSEIVHGNIKGSNQEEKESVARDFEENMRISLKKYIELFKTGNYREHSDLIQGMTCFTNPFMRYLNSINLICITYSCSA
jgi:hypothetical protein